MRHTLSHKWKILCLRRSDNVSSFNAADWVDTKTGDMTYGADTSVFRLLWIPQNDKVAITEHLVCSLMYGYAFVTPFECFILI